MVTHTADGKHFMTVVLDDGDDRLIKPISPAFVNQTEPVLNREDGMYVDLCICVWHHSLFWCIPMGCWWFVVSLFYRTLHPYGMMLPERKGPIPNW